MAKATSINSLSAAVRDTMRSWDFGAEPGGTARARWNFCGVFSDVGGLPTHVTEMRGDVIAFRPIEGGRWTECPITFRHKSKDERRADPLRGTVKFKGKTYNVWFNYDTGHDGNLNKSHYDLKPHTGTPDITEDDLPC